MTFVDFDSVGKKRYSKRSAGVVREMFEFMIEKEEA